MTYEAGERQAPPLKCPHLSLTGLAGVEQATQRFENVNFLNRFLAPQGASENMTRIWKTHRHTSTSFIDYNLIPTEIIERHC